MTNELPSAFLVSPGLWVGDLDACATWARGPILHCAKDPCWVQAVRARTLPKDHPEYLSAEREGGLYLNMIDPPLPLFQVPMFTQALDWLDRFVVPAGELLIHCNLGASRAPTMALLWLAKRAFARSDGRLSPIPATSFAEARVAFAPMYDRGMGDANYAPGAGLVTFLTDRWGEIE